MGAPDSVPVPTAAPGEEVLISVPMVAPTLPGKYVGYWRLVTAEGKKFGQRVKVRTNSGLVLKIQVAIRVSSDESSDEGKEIPVLPEVLAMVEELNLDINDKHVYSIIHRKIPENPMYVHHVGNELKLTGCNKQYCCVFEIVL